MTLIIFTPTFFNIDICSAHGRAQLTSLVNTKTNGK
jgi:hypothetical protein